MGLEVWLCCGRIEVQRIVADQPHFLFARVRRTLFLFFFKGTREYAWVSALHLTLYPVPIDEAGFVLAAVYSTKRDP